MKAVDYFLDFMILCALIGVGIWMLTDGNFVFGALYVLGAVLHGYRTIKRIDNDYE